MSVLFVYTHINVNYNPSYQCGVGYIVSVLAEAGIEVDLVYITDPTEGIGKLKAKVDDFSPTIIAYSSVSSQFQYVEEIAAQVKNEYGIFQVCGGVHATLNPGILAADSPFDAIVVGEGEYPLLELARSMEKGSTNTGIKNIWFKCAGGSIIKNPTRPFIENIDDLPPPNREVFNYQWIIDDDAGFGRFIFSRGCPFKCTYCANEALSSIATGRYFRLRSVPRALEEIEYVFSRYNVHYVAFEDDILTLDKQWFYSFMNQYKKNYKVSFACNVRPGTCDEDMFRVLKDAGCHTVGMGIESGDDHVRRKVLNRKLNRDQLIRSFQWAKNAGLRVKSYNLIGLPHETPEQFLETIRLNACALPDSRTVNVFFPYKNTVLGDEAYKNDLLLTRDVAIREREQTVLKNPYFPEPLIYHLRNNFHPLVNWAAEKGRLNRIEKKQGLDRLTRYAHLKKEIQLLRDHIKVMATLALLENRPNSKEPVYIYSEKDFLEDLLQVVKVFEIEVAGSGWELRQWKQWVKENGTTPYCLVKGLIATPSEIDDYINNTGIEAVDVFSSFRSIDRFQKECTDDVAVAVYSAGEITLDDCLASLNRQNLCADHIATFPHSTPGNPAFNNMMTALKTQYILVVDSDMLVAEDCLEKLYYRMSKHPDCYLVRAPIYDYMLGEAGYICLYNRTFIMEYVCTSEINWERQLEDFMRQCGRQSITLDKILAKRISAYDRETTFRQFKKLAEKHMYLDKPITPILQNIAKGMAEDWNLLSQYALAGIFAGLGPTPGKLYGEISSFSTQQDQHFREIDRYLLDGKSEVTFAVQQAQYYLNQNERTIAEAFLQLAKKKLGENGGDRMDSYHVASLLKKLGRYRDSIDRFKELLNRGVELTDNLQGRIHYHLGESYINLIDPENARLHFTECLRRIPNHQKARTFLEDIK